jgi:hypothetical protein
MVRVRGRFGAAGPSRQRRGVPATLTATARRASGDSVPSDSINAGGAGGTPYLCHLHLLPALRPPQRYASRYFGSTRALPLP